MLPISDDGSIDIDSSLYTRDSESEGGIWGYHDDDNVSIAPEGAQLIPLDDQNGTPIIGSPVGGPVGRRNEGENLPLNIVPVPIQAPEEAIGRHHGKAKQSPLAVWRCGAHGKLERIAMSVVQREQESQSQYICLDFLSS
jgi:hypothetical protein